MSWPFTVTEQVAGKPCGVTDADIEKVLPSPPTPTPRLLMVGGVGVEMDRVAAGELPAVFTATTSTLTVAPDNGTVAVNPDGVTPVPFAVT
jgi:hypothetical protein